MSTSELNTKKGCIKMLKGIFYEIKFLKHLDYMKIRKNSLARHLTSDAICNTNKKTAEYAVRFYKAVTKPHPLNEEKANSYKSKIISSLEKKNEAVKLKLEKCESFQVGKKTFKKVRTKNNVGDTDKSVKAVKAVKAVNGNISDHKKIHKKYKKSLKNKETDYKPIDKDRKKKKVDKEKKVSFSMNGGYECRKGHL